jgi:hypothetical protein
MVEQQARAVEIFQRVIQRFTVIGIGACSQQHLGENRIADHSSRSVKRGQWLGCVGRCERSGRKPVADTLIRIGTGLKKMLRAFT